MHSHQALQRFQATRPPLMRLFHGQQGLFKQSHADVLDFHQLKHGRFVVNALELAHPVVIERDGKVIQGGVMR